MNAEPQTTVLPRKSRAQTIRDMVEIRLAVNGAGPAIAQVLKANGIELTGANWNSVFPHWLIATVGDDVIGCCQVLPAKPVGYVEFLFVMPSVPFKLRAIAIRKLIIQSMATLHYGGCQYVGAVIEAKNVKFANVLEKLHFVKTYRAEMYAKRLI